MIDHLVTLGFLVLLQAVLGFDNLLYISLESKRAPEPERQRVRRLGIGLAIGLRIGLLVILLKLIDAVNVELFGFAVAGVAEAHFNVHSLIVLIGGVFILYTAVKEIWHMMHLEEAEEKARQAESPGKIIALIVVMNLVFSVDSILSAMALTKNVWVMSIAIVIGGVLMIVLSDRVSTFLQKNRMFEVLGLFVLLIVGIMLLSEGGHLSHMKLFGGEITQMSKATFYFVIAVLVLTDVVQARYQRALIRRRQARKTAEAS